MINFGGKEMLINQRFLIFTVDSGALFY